MVVAPTASWDDDGTGGVADDWDAEPAEKPAAKPAAAAAAAAPKGQQPQSSKAKSLAARLKEKEENERKAAAAERRKALDAEEAKRRADPEYMYAYPSLTPRLPRCFITAALSTSPSLSFEEDG